MASNQYTTVPTKISISARVFDRECIAVTVGLQQQSSNPRGVIGHGPMDRAAIVHGDSTGSSFKPLNLSHWKRCDVLIANRARPGTIGSVLVKEWTHMAPWENAHWSHFFVRVVKVNANGQWREVSVRPKLNVLMPLDLLSAVRPFVIQFAVVEAHGATQDRLG